MKRNKSQKSKYENSDLLNARTPTGNYVLSPKTVVCPGILSKYIPQKITHKFSSHSGQLTERPKTSTKFSTKLSKLFERHSVLSNAALKSAMVVNQLQGTLEIHLKSLELTDAALSRIEGRPHNFKLSWKFFTYEKSSLPLFEVSANHIVIESSVIYCVDLSDSFFDFVLTKNLSLDLTVTVDTKEYYMARGEFHLSDVLEHPLNYLYAYVDFCDSDKAILLSNTGITIMFGTLTLWYRLSCDVETLRSLISRAGRVSYSSTTGTKPKYSGGTKSSSVLTFSLHSDSSNDVTESKNSLKPTSSETDNFQEALDLVLTRNKALRTAQSEISRELDDRARWLHEESNWKRTLQEHAILRGKNPAEVQWRQWRSDSSSNIKLRQYRSEVVLYKPEVVIKVTNIVLSKDSAPVKNEKLKKIYVEYSFLTHDGIEMECPFSVTKSVNEHKMVFNFEKKFPIDPDINNEDCQKLVEALKNNEDLIISVVGEPGHSDPSDLPCCEEVCIAKIPLLELIERSTNVIVDDLLLHDRKDELTVMGYLRVHIKGILAMRRLALKLLAPPNYHIFD